MLLHEPSARMSADTQDSRQAVPFPLNPVIAIAVINGREQTVKKPDILMRSARWAFAAPIRECPRRPGQRNGERRQATCLPRRVLPQCRGQSGPAADSTPPSSGPAATGRPAALFGSKPECPLARLDSAGSPARRQADFARAGGERTVRKVDTGVWFADGTPLRPTAPGASRHGQRTGREFQPARLPRRKLPMRRRRSVPASPATPPFGRAATMPLAVDDP